MTAKHTPGTWSVLGRAIGNGPPHSMVGVSTILARVYAKAYGDHEEEKANAALIAAAPDLLEALMAIKADGCMIAADAANGKIVDAAIAKATGA